ncbi:uncharacterized protein JN550_007475 [Neoarthrinium moseri]|uniref:uncharacterized protein n=1 Tax=Neoarthrinium moseri TaxID=1658444 RepID=UPI001FDB0EB9|nr:uncharacterized protein JN550_007475 [Neoarthrinium moseri]KAI1866622.1 hypothetical protein JN550_007475 [Neoarthrinium moseri]
MDSPMDVDTSPKAGEKRSSPAAAPGSRDGQPNKKQRTETLEPELQPQAQPQTQPQTAMGLAGDEDMPDYPIGLAGTAAAGEHQGSLNEADFARDGLQRSIVLALQHVGFDSASREALESFTSHAEKYLTTFVQHVKRFAESARREQPTPADFDVILRKHNIPVSSLKPHLKNPIAKEKLEPTYYDPCPTPPHADYFRTTSTAFLGPELDGTADRQERPWIPDWLPPFPSKHTYMFTPVEAAPPDPARKRQEAVQDALLGEKALRKINRAAKMSQQKELTEIARRNALSKQRHDRWEEMMKSMIPEHGAAGERQEIADHSIIVDSSVRYKRREVPREHRVRPQG